MPIVKLGNFDPIIITGGLVPRGAFDAGTTYAIGDSVDYFGSSYVMFALDGTNTLPTNASYWQVLASKGDKGDQGDQGIQGVQGDPGEGIASGYLYFPSVTLASTDGSWRVGLSGNSMVFQRRESGNWIDKGEVTP